MAPFPRGRAGGRARGVHRGRGRGRGSSVSRGRKSSTYYSTRVEEQVESASDKSIKSDVGEEEPIEEDGDDVTSEEDKANKTNIRPYHALLQSLKSNELQGPSQRKKRRVERTGSSEHESKGNLGLEMTAKQNIDGNSDAIDEPEEGPSPIAEGFAEEVGIDENEDASDPFEVHFANPNENDLSRKLRMISQNQWRSERAQIPHLGKSIIVTPDIGRTVTTTTNGRLISGPQDLELKKKLSGPASKTFSGFNELEATLASHIFNYQDLLFPVRSTGNAESIRRLACLHAMNHVLKTRDRVIKNNARLAKEPENGDLELRDQGFTRPKVLMLLPTRQACVKAVDTITALCEPEQQENKKRFQDTYVQADEKFSEDKPEDFRELFGGNDDDMFRLGLKLTRKTFKFFAQFYNSDIIFASPLGLRMAIGAEDAKKQDYDFLSSIEVIVVDQADALLMQNWEHVEFIFEHLNLQPKEARGCDFSRVRNWYLDSNAKYLRQTLLISAFNTPEINSLFTNHMHNMAGKVKISKSYDGAIVDLGVQIKQTFSRFDSLSLSSDPDIRFKYFTTTIIPSLTRQVRSPSAAGHGILIFIPSYLDFVRVRNYFSDSSSTQNISFGSISEYTSVRDVARARSHFFSGRHAVLLYTERAHHFRRYHIRGLKRVVMYGIPDNPIFYREIVGGYLGASLGEGKAVGDEAGLRAIFSRWDVLKLERIVGTKRVASMLQEKGGDTFDFV